jgi:CRP-like cAMP-binding protein
VYYKFDIMSRRSSMTASKARRSSVHVDVPASFMTGNKIVTRIVADRERLSFDFDKIPKHDKEVVYKVLQTHASCRASAEIDFLLDRIRDFPLFAIFSAKDIAGVIEGSLLRKCEPRTVLCAESASAVNGHLFILLSGKVSTNSQSQTGLWKAVKSKAVYSATDNALDMIDLNQEMFFIAGDAFGEECILQDCMGIYERTAITQTECVIMEVTSQNALKILQANLKLRVDFRKHFFYNLINPDRKLDQKRLKIELFSHTRDWQLMKRLTKDAGVKLLSMIDVIEVMANKQVFMQGDKNDYVFIVFQGQVDVFLNTSTGKKMSANDVRKLYPEGPITMEEKAIYGTHIASMTCGQIFGDFYDEESNNTRSASVVCRNEDCTLLRIPKDLYIDNFILTASMAYTSENWMPVLSRPSAERTLNDLQLLMHMAASVPLLQRFPKIDRQVILREMQHSSITIRRQGDTSDDLRPNYEVIIEEGPILDEDPSMFWVLQGNLQVRSMKNQFKSVTCSPFANMDSQQLETALDLSFGTLDFIVREGHVVGESILHTDSASRKRTASVIAVSSVILGVIKRSVCQPHLPFHCENPVDSETRNDILTKLPIDRTPEDIGLLSELCSKSQVLQHLPTHVSECILRESHGIQFGMNEVVYIQNSRAHFFAILLEGSLTSHAFNDVDPSLMIREEHLFAETARQRRILTSLVPPIADVRITRVRDHM